MTELEILIALNLTGHIGASLYRRLLERFQDLNSLKTATESELSKVDGIGPLISRSIVKCFRTDIAQKEIEKANKQSVKIVTFTDEDFPALLKSIYDPPLVLYVKGDYAALNSLSIAIVGSRRASMYGKSQAFRFAKELADLGICIVSGLARGIDTQAHLGALRSAKGRTVAVLGSGLTRVYPPENRRLADQIASSGCVVTEFPLDQDPKPENFPRRNRIISGLSLGTVCTEASITSGAIITCDHAIEQGREVFAVPGEIRNPLSSGCHMLIKNGAKLVEDVSDILEEIQDLRHLLKDVLSPLEQTILRFIQKTPLSLQSITARASTPSSITSRVITSLVKKRLIEETDSGYKRVLE